MGHCPNPYCVMFFSHVCMEVCFRRPLGVLLFRQHLDFVYGVV
ncbi:hypothetical protein KAS14_06835 [Candidatus Bathyarchaeota archaeon]|nr:hypothetical protein [Candidatus Bathyarchaeota archaeon]